MARLHHSLFRTIDYLFIMGLHTVRLELDAWLREDTLAEDTNIDARTEALDFIRYVEQIGRARRGNVSLPISTELETLGRSQKTNPIYQD